jgi:hypothetical protein
VGLLFPFAFFVVIFSAQAKKSGAAGDNICSGIGGVEKTGLSRNFKF